MKLAGSAAQCKAFKDRATAVARRRVVVVITALIGFVQEGKAETAVAANMQTSVVSRDGLFGNPIMLWAVAAIITLQLCFAYLPLFQNLFGTAAITLADWVRLIGFTATVFVLVECEKLIVRRMAQRNGEQSFE